MLRRRAEPDDADHAVMLLIAGGSLQRVRYGFGGIETRTTALLGRNRSVTGVSPKCRSVVRECAGTPPLTSQAIRSNDLRRRSRSCHCRASTGGSERSPVVASGRSNASLTCRGPAVRAGERRGLRCNVRNVESRGLKSQHRRRRQCDPNQPRSCSVRYSISLSYVTRRFAVCLGSASSTGLRSTLNPGSIIRRPTFTRAVQRRRSDHQHRGRLDHRGFDSAHRGSACPRMGSTPPQRTREQLGACCSA